MTVVSVEPAARRGRSLGEWGMIMLILTEGMIFAGLLSSYFFLQATSPEWPQGAIEKPGLWRISVMTVVLLASSAPVVWAEHGLKKGDRSRAQVGLALTFLMGLVFIVHQGIEYHELGFGWQDNAYASIFYTTTGLHGLHVLIGLYGALFVLVKLALGRLTEDHHQTMTLFGWYWHFVDGVWVFVFSSLYLSVQL